MPLLIGRMDRRIDIEQDTATSADSYGQVVPSWGVLDTVWARVTLGGDRARAGSERHEGNQDHAQRTAEFRIRYRTDVTEKMRIRYPASSGDIYDIESIIEIGRQVGLDITATASVP